MKPSQSLLIYYIYNFKDVSIQFFGDHNDIFQSPQRTGNESTDRAAVPTSFPGFSPFRPYGLSTGRRENLGTRLLGFKLGFVPVFHFPVPRFSNMPKKSYLDNLFGQETGEWKWTTFSEIQYVFPLFLRTYLVKENYDNNVSIRHFTNGARFSKGQWLFEPEGKILK